MGHCSDDTNVWSRLRMGDADTEVLFCNLRSVFGSEHRVHEHSVKQLGGS